MNGNTADSYPVQRTVGILGKGKIGNKQSDRRHGNRHSQLHNNVRPPQNNKHRNKHEQSQQNRHDLLECVAVIDSRNIRQSDARKQKSDYFNFKIVLPEESRGNYKISPFKDNKSCIDHKKLAVEAVARYRNGSRQHLKYCNEDQSKSPVKFIIQLFAAHGIPPFDFFDLFIINHLSENLNIFDIFLHL